MNSEIVIDGAGGILGRIAAFSAKQALFGKSIIIVNCNDVLITGRRELIIEKYKTLRKKGGSSQKGPILPKIPERIMKRTIRGMLSHKQWRGKTAHKKIICYNSCPAEFESAQKISLARTLKTKAIKLSELVKLL